MSDNDAQTMFPTIVGTSEAIACFDIMDSAFESAERQSLALRHVYLDGCCKVTDDALTMLPKLTNLDLSNLPRLTPDTVTYISSHCKNIRCLNLSLNAIINDDCLEALSKNLPGLWRLYCVSCCISDRGIAAVATNCPFLKCLDIGWCQDITDIGVKSVTSQCAYLEYLGLIRCDKVTLATMEQLVLKYPRVNFSTFILESRRLLERARREGYVFDVEISK
ncbi:FXL17-like protein [Mya arenaria]|uniref:FXL17-like protein n=1 Tax=Mya arenaria TaxID=6604 RepID=A0ABY7G9E1_MYAAR|nr:FXL17-like protein [Mya arenaria]